MIKSFCSWICCRRQTQEVNERKKQQLYIVESNKNNSNEFLQNKNYETPMEIKNIKTIKGSGGMMRIEVKLVNGSVKHFQMAEDQYVFSIKYHIFNTISNELDYLSMSLYLNGTKLRDEQTLKSLTRANSLSLVQKMLQIEDFPSEQQVYRQREDPHTYEKGLVKKGPKNKEQQTEKEIKQINPIQQIKRSGGMIKIDVKLVNGSLKQFQMAEDQYVFSIKYHIFNKISNELDYLRMSLYLNGTKLQDDQMIKSLARTGSLSLVQKKLDIEDFSQDLEVDRQREDPDTYEKGLVKASCGCFIGTQALTMYIKNIITESNFQLKCRKCGKLWEWKHCKKIGVFTKAQIQQFEKGLSKNYFSCQFFSNKMKQCPKCHAYIEVQNPQISKVGCVKCGDYCFKCKKKWNPANINICKNLQCLSSDQKNAEIYSKLITNCGDMILKLNDRGGKTGRQYNVPQRRACVYCQCMIEYVSGCKHMLCICCHKQFCFVCLSKKVNGWTCGYYNQYCGSIAPKQRK